MAHTNREMVQIKLLINAYYKLINTLFQILNNDKILLNILCIKNELLIKLPNMRLKYVMRHVSISFSSHNLVFCIIHDPEKRYFIPEMNETISVG